MPVPVLAGALAPLLIQVLRYVFMAHAVGFIIRIFSVIGLTLATNEYVVEPLLDIVRGEAQGVPAEMAEWLSFFGIDKVISIMASAYTLLAVKKVFLGKAS